MTPAIDDEDIERMIDIIGDGDLTAEVHNPTLGGAELSGGILRCPSGLPASCRWPPLLGPVGRLGLVQPWGVMTCLAPADRGGAQACAVTNMATNMCFTKSTLSRRSSSPWPRRAQSDRDEAADPNPIAVPRGSGSSDVQFMSCLPQRH